MKNGKLRDKPGSVLKFSRGTFSTAVALVEDQG